MAVTNSLKPTDKRNSQEMVFTLAGQEIRLTPQIVKDYMVSGSKENVTTQEVVMFMNLCKYAGLNPWMKEAYLIKYGSSPATMVTGKAAFEVRAEQNPNFDGKASGVIVLKDDGSLDYRNGAFTVPNEKLVGGWASVYRKDLKYPIHTEVSFDEYAGRTRDGNLNGQWASKPATMIRKVALVQALREAFPKSYSGLYAAEEVGATEDIPNVVEQAPEAAVVTEELSKEKHQEESAMQSLFGEEV